jgi:hypothetical protein
VNGLEIGIGVLYLGLGGLIAWLLVQARHAPRSASWSPGQRDSGDWTRDGTDVARPTTTDHQEWCDD